eukprot:CAMPEP_0119275810 /NCGR_PEP_ID=MMETSP1329-20130426/14474_1 /TAXON_ID=114041 /ORGANISM="Genus nov. species nov., Strain RCC1024" /LENGTH=58 /DNA_ID=CAMNT_0007276229 /DNA_START=54 /DNA_END=227 /DNA_ORIENTATION=-
MPGSDAPPLSDAALRAALACVHDRPACTDIDARQQELAAAGRRAEAAVLPFLITSASE